MTFLSVQAALSGCLSIIIPDDEGQYSKENLIKVNRIPGIAIGHDDTDWAKSTQKDLITYLETLNEEQLNTILSFKNFFENLLSSEKN
jgi:uncharacterized protein YceK